MTDTTIALEWAELMTTWDRQQQGYLPAREERFCRMFDAVEVLVGEEFLALDRACGPGRSASGCCSASLPRAASPSTWIRC